MAVPGVSSEQDGRSPPRFLQPAVCAFSVPVCVYLPRMCLRLYLSVRVCCLCFPFCSVSETVGETSVFNQGPENCLVVTTVATVLLIRLIGNDLSEPSMTLDRRDLVLGPSQREQQEGALSNPSVPRRETKAHSCRRPLSWQPEKGS